MDARKQQEDEFLVLESIYNSEEFVKKENSALLGGHLFVHHDLPKSFKIIVRRYKEDGEVEIREVPVSKLPPINLNFTLPLNYPAESPPLYTISCPWLTPVMLTELCLKLDNLWLENQGTEILFIWFDYLKENIIELFSINNSITVDDLSTAHFGKKALINSLSSLHIGSANNDDQCNSPSKSSSVSRSSSATQTSVPDQIEAEPGGSTQPNSEKNEAEPGGSSESSREQHEADLWNATSFISPDEQTFSCDSRVLVKNVDIPVHISLAEYNTMKVHEELMKSQILCNACFDEKLGTECTQFTPCCHVFCKECVSSYFETQIKENRVFALGCLENKCDSSASQAQVREHVSTALFELYDKLLLDASLVVLTDIVYCPRKFCNYPVTREPNENLAVCPDCKYPFCVLCKMTYHGIENCKFASGEKRAVVLAYQNGDAQTKLELELRYGRRQLQTLLSEELSSTWISSHSKNCPNCSAPIEKDDGCNKMTCTKCGTFFCWICGMCLSQDRPYDHFSLLTSKCYNRLFEGIVAEEDDDEEFPDDGFDHLTPEEVDEQFLLNVALI